MMLIQNKCVRNNSEMVDILGYMLDTKGPEIRLGSFIKWYGWFNHTRRWHSLFLHDRR